MLWFAIIPLKCNELIVNKVEANICINARIPSLRHPVHPTPPQRSPSHRHRKMPRCGCNSLFRALGVETRYIGWPSSENVSDPF